MWNATFDHPWGQTGSGVFSSSMKNKDTECDSPSVFDSFGQFRLNI